MSFDKLDEFRYRPTGGTVLRPLEGNMAPLSKDFFSGSQEVFQHPKAFALVFAQFLFVAFTVQARTRFANLTAGCKAMSPAGQRQETFPAFLAAIALADGQT